MAYFVPDFWHKQAVDLAGARGCVKTLDFWHSAGAWTDTLRTKADFACPDNVRMLYLKP
jgi:hypothetical protein